MENQSSDSQTVVRHFKSSRTIRLDVGKTVHQPLSSANTHLHVRPSLAGAFQFPIELPCIAHAFAKPAEAVLLFIVPQHRPAKHHANWHLIGQRLKPRAWAPPARKMDLRPRPEVPVPIPSVVPLHPLPQRLPSKGPVIQRNLA